MRKVAIAGILVLALFLVLFAAYRVLPGLLVVPEVTVPNLVGMSLPEAERELEAKGLGSHVAAEIYSDDIPVNHIALQEPAAGRSVRKERVVELTISAGPQYAEIPNLIGRTEREARLLLDDLGLVMELSYDYNGDIAAGLIMRQDPGHGFRLTRGETVKVVISEGGRPFTLRDFRGWTLNDTQAWLNLYGLILRNFSEEYSDTFAQGQVISQSPPAGETVRTGDAVDLAISKGRDTTAYPVHNVELHPAVPAGKHIKITVLDMEGERIIFEGAYGGQVFTVQGVGAGRIILMERRDDEYYTVDIKQFP